MDAKRLLEGFRQNLFGIEKERQRLLQKPEDEKKLLEAYKDWNSSRTVLSRQLTATLELLSAVDRNCSEAIREALVQEEADHCRKSIVDHSIESENEALRAVIEHGTETEARRAVESLLAPYVDETERLGSEEKKLNQEWIATIRRCASKIRSPQERLAGSRIFMERCKNSKEASKIQELLASNNKSETEWRSVKLALKEEEKHLKTFLDAHRCKQAIDELLRKETS